MREEACAGKVLTRDTFDAEAFVVALEGGLKAVQDRGGAKVGDKAMVDALAPAAVAARSVLDNGASMEQAAEAAKAAASGADASRDSSQKLVSRKGWATEPLDSLIPAP